MLELRLKPKWAIKPVLELRQSTYTRTINEVIIVSKAVIINKYLFLTNIIYNELNIVSHEININTKYEMIGSIWIMKSLFEILILL